MEAAFHGDPAALSKEEVTWPIHLVKPSVQTVRDELYLANIPLVPRIMTDGRMAHE